MPEDKEKGTETVNFEELQLEGGETPSRSEQLLSLLSENLDEEKLSAAKKILGMQEEMSNIELLAEIQKLLGEKQAAEGEGEGEGEGEESYKDFMKKCVGGGKDLKTCAAEYKEKYPKAAEPSEEDLAEVEELAKKKPEEEEDEDPIKKEMARLNAEIADLKKLNRDDGIDVKVDAMVEAKNLSPNQAVKVKKLMKTLPDGEHVGILDIFRSQKMTTHKDVALMPGGKTEGLTPEEKLKLMKSHGLVDLMKAKGGILPGVE